MNRPRKVLAGLAKRIDDSLPAVHGDEAQPAAALNTTGDTICKDKSPS